MNISLRAGCTLAVVKNSVLNTVLPVTFRLQFPNLGGANIVIL